MNRQSILLAIASLTLTATTANAQSITVKGQIGGQPATCVEAVDQIKRADKAAVIVYDQAPPDCFINTDITATSTEDALKKLLEPSHTVVRDNRGTYHIRRAGPGQIAARPKDPTPAARPEPTEEPGIMNRVNNERYTIQYPADWTSGMVVGQHGNYTYGDNGVRRMENPFNYDRYVVPYPADWGGMVIGQYGNYTYGDNGSEMINLARQARNFLVENVLGAFKIDAGVIESDLQNMNVYVDGCYREVASKLNNWHNGKAALTEGGHVIEVVDLYNGLGYSEDVQVLPAAATKAFQTQHFNIRVDQTRMAPAYQRAMVCQATKNLRAQAQ